MGGAARIPFVAGLDSHMPAAIGKVHPRYATPHVALVVQALVSLVLIVLNFTLSGAGGYHVARTLDPNGSPNPRE